MKTVLVTAALQLTGNENQKRVFPCPKIKTIPPMGIALPSLGRPPPKKIKIGDRICHTAC